MSKRKLNICVILLSAIFILFMFINVFQSEERAYADKTMDGYNLNGYSVKINYCYYTKYISGVYFAFEVIFDKDFYMKLDKTKAFDGIKDTFIKNNYLLDLDTVGGKMTAYRNFDSITDYYIALGIDGYEKNSSFKPEKKTLFYSDYVSSNTTVFADIKKEGKFINRIYNACVDLGIEDDKILLNYIYGTPYSEKTIKSSADTVKYSSADKIYFHTFVMTMDTFDNTITLSQHVPNSTGWYLLALFICIAVITVPFSILIVKKTKEKKNG